MSRCICNKILTEVELRVPPHDLCGECRAIINADLDGTLVERPWSAYRPQQHVEHTDVD